MRNEIQPTSVPFPQGWDSGTPQERRRQMLADGRRELLTLLSHGPLPRHRLEASTSMTANRLDRVLRRLIVEGSIELATNDEGVEICRLVE